MLSERSGLPLSSTSLLDWPGRKRPASFFVQWSKMNAAHGLLEDY